MKKVSAKNSEGLAVSQRFRGTGGARTRDLMVNSHLLYPLSYRAMLVEAEGLEPTNSEETRFTVWRRCRLAMLPYLSGWMDSNHRPSHYQCDALTH